MTLIPKTLFKWREPRYYLARRDIEDEKNRKIWHDIAGVAVVMALMLVIWRLAVINPEKDPVSIDIAIVLAFTLGILLYYLMPWVARLCPSEVKLTDKGLMTKPGPMRAWSWKDIISFNFTRRHGCRVMLLETRKGKTIEIGMGDYVSQDEVKQFLTSLGIDRVGEVAIERRDGNRGTSS